MQELFFSGKQGLGVVGDGDGERSALIAFGQYFLFQGHAFQAFGLHVQEIVVVPDACHASGQYDRDGRRPSQNAFGMTTNRVQPAMKLQRLGQSAVLIAVGHVDKCGQNRHGSQAAEEHSAAGDDSQLGNAHEFGESGHVKGNGSGYHSHNDSRRNGAGGFQQGIFNRTI